MIFFCRFFKFTSYCFSFYLLNLFLERGEGSKKEIEKNINMREKHQLVASHTCPDREPQVCALTGN